MFASIITRRVASSQSTFSGQNSKSIARRFLFAEPHNIELYEYAICPFCNRVKAFLDYAGLKYSQIEVNPLTKKEIKWSKDYRKVPIVKLDQKPLLGSDSILEALLQQPIVQENLESKWEGSNMSMDEFATSELSQRWTKFATDELAYLLYPNICRTLSDSYRAFAYVETTDSFGTLEKLSIRGLGSLAMYMAASRVKKKRNITDERAALHQALVQLEQDGLRDHDFVSGNDKPNLGDITLFGTLRSIEGLPAHKKAIESRDGPLRAWYERMSAEVVSSKKQV
ncbi:microsomal prostaglandin-E synthase 2 [Fistulifera solaris]|uniref:Microsomal prostaglandin-E synthase 2 n=1 Tax=Fistulifera solaris TaxID=1519565 RepID=A0A1Z5KDB4_FISSO|nr:microsomal prostaglandin-E synthase 2 [Fistulifera solaris]|eukprot:GAX24243.1 microsomal prostaglandin-E synthase 2 [Fistulifera solaris]